VQLSQEIDAFGRVLRELQRFRRHHSIADAQIVAPFKANLAVFVNVNAVARGHSNRPPVGGLYLIQNLVERVADDAFNRSEPNAMIVQSETKDLA